MITKEGFVSDIAMLAQRAVLYEVITTPKPGLIDCNNSGSHKDMDIFTFMASATAINNGFIECVKAGSTFSGVDKDKLLDIIRPIGLECEEAMFKSTKGINTHKGVIFSLGILCAVTGYLWSTKKEKKLSIEEICESVKDVCRNITKKDFINLDSKSNLSYGEKLFLQYGYKGIRGEVESGFKTILKTSIPILRDWNSNKALEKNELFIQMLFSIMTESEDTNIVTRGGVENLNYVRNVASNFLKNGGVYQKDYREKLIEMNNEFVSRNISPGGSADLLAVSIYLGLIEGLIE